MSALTLRSAARTDTGRVRDHNEDAVFGECAEAVIAAALVAGSRDNVSAVVADVVEGGRVAWRR